MNAVLATLNRLPLATAMTDALRAGYGAASLRRDLIAALIISLVALPLSMALAIAVGLPPQHGLYTAIAAGFFAALLGGSKTQVSGPTAAFVVIVAPIVAEFGMRGIVWCQILAGIFLLILGISRLGQIITYVPYTVTMGFTMGIGVVIGTIALNDFFGVAGDSAGHWPHKVAVLAQNLPDLSLPTLGVGLLALAIMAGLPYINKKIPSAIVGIVAATLVSLGLSRAGIDIATIGSRFSYTDAAGVLHHGIPSMPPVLHLPGFSDDRIYALPSIAELSKWFMPAVVIAILAALESLLSATVADSMAGTRHEPNAELNGIGIANIMSGLFLGIPATGAIARTATNINAGAVSPVSAMVHALLLLLFMVVLAPVIAYVPMSALSALLLVTAWRMSHVHQFIHLVRSASRSDIAVTLACFGMTVAIDMVAGVITGMSLAILLFMKRVMDTTAVSHHHGADNRTEYDLPDGTLLFHVEGPLFFGTANKAFDFRPGLLAHVERVVLDLGDVPAIDVTAMNLLEDYIGELLEGGRQVVICADADLTARIRRRLRPDVIVRVHFVGDVEDMLNRRAAIRV
ncbi:MAG: STAS domain-containing protein [Rhodospirillales bacterium]|nr:STAS domain-containing protein [Alphaproteobacteria bacterium]MCB9987108.1 STAS domain-containing protein [Rhodospirillales bacterium]USO08133.1 MAG: STAS domain-containing protein [Rhodospirillales bacterium]